VATVEAPLRAVLTDAPAARTPSERLAAFVASLRFDDLPAHVVLAAQQHILDTFGVALRGHAHPNAQRALASLSALDAAGGRIAVWGSRTRLAAPYAALVNGVAAHVLDFDDTHTDAIVHGSAILAPLVMAQGERLARHGHDAIVAFVAGWEVAARVGLAARGTFHARGFHTTAIAGVFGAAAAAASMLRLAPSQTAHALGLAASQAAGINEYLSNGSSAKSVHVGWSAHAGIVAATLAGGGMTGPSSVFEGRDGLLRTHGERASCDVDALDAELGDRWEMTRVSIKPYPCCHFAHAFVDCVAGLERQGVNAANVASIECVVPDLEVPLICEPLAAKHRPETPYAAKFSLPFLLATRIVDGRVGHDSFDPRNLQRDDLLTLASRVGYRRALPGETRFPATFPGWVEVTLTDGCRLVERLAVNAGHPERPLTREALEAKFLDNAQDALGERRAKRVIELVAALPDVPVATLATALSATQDPSPGHTPS
jgi:2-methylcitrate dehydratase PrpD